MRGVLTPTILSIVCIIILSTLALWNYYYSFNPVFEVGECLFCDPIDEKWENDIYYASKVVDIGERKYLLERIYPFGPNKILDGTLTSEYFSMANDFYKKIDCNELNELLKEKENAQELSTQ